MKITALFSAVAFALGLAIGAGAAGSHYRHKIAKMEGQRIERESAIASAVMETKLAQIQQIHGALDAAQKQTVQAQRDADSARVAAGKLRGALADYRARYPAGTASPGQGKQSGDPIGVLADLLSRMGEAGERISRYADEVKIAGAACEAAWPTHANFESKP